MFTGVTAVWTDFSILTKVVFAALVGVSALAILGLLLFFSKRREIRQKRKE